MTSSLAGDWWRNAVEAGAEVIEDEAGRARG